MIETSSDYLAERAALQAQAVEVLTKAVRLTRPRGDGSTEPDDFADFLAWVLAAVAANVGSVWRVTEGRPGSWKADLVDQLVRGTVGHDPDLETLLAYRTEPVRVLLNVGQLVEEEGSDAAPPVRAYWEEVDSASPLPTDPDADLSDEEWEALEAAHGELEATVRERHVQAYVAYAEQFRALVIEEAQVMPGLVLGEVPVEVVVETDPDAAWRSINNPTEWDDDPIVWHFWRHARQRLGLPRP